MIALMIIVAGLAVLFGVALFINWDYFRFEDKHNSEWNKLVKEFKEGNK